MAMPTIRQRTVRTLTEPIFCSLCCTASLQKQKYLSLLRVMRWLRTGMSGSKLLAETLHKSII